MSKKSGWYKWEEEEAYLADDGADLAGGGRDTVRGRTVTSGEDFTGDDEGGAVGSEVEEELGNDVETEETVGGELVVGETHGNEEDGQHTETHELNGLAADGVDGGDRDPVAGDGTSEDDDQVTDGGVVQELVGGVGTAGGVTDGSQDGGVVERETVVGDIEEAPREGGTGEELGVLGHAVVADEVAEAGLVDGQGLGSILLGGDTGNLVGVTLVLAAHVGLDVRVGLLDVTSDVEGVAGSLGDGQTVVEGDDTGDGTETDEDSPHLVNSEAADASAVGLLGGGEERLLEAESDEEHDESGGELTKTLHGEDSAHHGTTPLGGSELGGDDGGERVVTTDTDTLRKWISVSSPGFCNWLAPPSPRTGRKRRTGMLTMRTRQKMMIPMMSMEGELEARAWARVAKMMTMSSRPYMRLRPTISARAPKPS